MRGVWIFLLLTGWCSAQEDGYVLAGSVVNARTGEPVKQALVTAFRFAARGDAGDGAAARPFRGAVPAPPFTVSALTDASGAFRFTGLTAGTYNLSAQKPHFTHQPTERALVRLESSGKEDVRVELSPLGTIEGKITDQRGQPASSVAVLVMQTSIVDGSRQTSVARSVWTDDRGMFRAWDIAPGRYLIRASGRGGNTSTYMSDDVPSSNGGFDGFVPAYFGGPTADSATPIVMEPGTEARADIGVIVQPAYKVRGTIANFGPGGVDFALLSGEENVGTGRVVFSRTSGAFEMLEVVNGSYTLRAAQGGKTVAEIPILVQGADVEGLRMTLAEAVQIPVNVRIVGQPTEQEKESEDGDLALSPPGFCMVTLHGGLGSGWSPVMLGLRQVGVDPAGGSPVLPGRYRVGVSCNGAYLVSAAMGTTDLLANPWITVSPGAAPATIEVVAHHGGGTISGAIKLDQEPTGKNLYVLAVPRVSTREPALVPAFEQIGRQFSFDSLAPGDYTLYGFSSDQVEYRNPEFLRGLTGGESVHVDEGASATVTITRLVQ
jgi:protocatechuate 3,4-dioxygenase beta subunit